MTGLDPVMESLRRLDEGVARAAEVFRELVDRFRSERWRDELRRIEDAFEFFRASELEIRCLVWSELTAFRDGPTGGDGHRGGSGIVPPWVHRARAVGVRSSARARRWKRHGPPGALCARAARARAALECLPLSATSGAT